MSDESMSTLPSRQMDLPVSGQDLYLRDKFVVPFWGTASATRILRLRPEEQASWLDDFAKASEELNESEALLLFDVKNFRWQIITAWMVGFRGWKQFSPFMMERFMVERVNKGHATAAMCLGIAMLAVPTDAELLCDFLDQGTEEKGWLSAAAALVELDRVHGTSHAEEYLHPGGMFEQMQNNYRDLYRPEMPLPELPRFGAIVDLMNETRARRS